MIDKNNNLDELDKMLFSYFDNNKDIPSSTQDTILNAFENPRTPTSLIYKIQKVAIVLISFIILTTGVVFAKDIINFITSLFTNTTEGINKAIENGYVQNVDMDFVYDNNIGIKVDYLVMDDNNLDISFVYDYKGDEQIETISIYEYIIRDEENNLIYYYFEDENEMNNKKCFSNHYERTLESKQFRESIWYTSNKLPNSQNLIFEIHSFQTNHSSKISGNWIFNIDIEEKILKRDNTTYTCSYNQYINTINSKLSETTFKISIELNTSINNDILLNSNNICLYNTNGKKYDYVSIKSGNHLTPTNNSISILELEFDISKYEQNIDTLNLFIQFDTNKSLTLLLKK